MKKKDLYIIKYSGESVLFDSNKLRNSLKYSGASKQEIDQIIKIVKSKLFEGISTKKIYRIVQDQLKKIDRPNAGRYNLKKGIMELGPTGFPFEVFIGELLKRQGYKVEVGVIVQGDCVQHEVDVVAEKDNEHFMIECKYHSSFSTKCNVKIPLYIQSRFLDIEKQWIKQSRQNHKFHQGWVVNNTRFTTDAIEYGNCVGLKLLSWDYPVKKSLKELIGIYGLYPITCLNTLKAREKQQLLDKEIVLCRQLCDKPVVLKKIGIKPNREKSILEDAKALCKSQL